MATYTDNYQLTKPTYAEQADIGVINSNMNKIDEILHSSQISLADAYNSTKTYAEGDVVMYELLMYKCISPTTGVWDGSKWERTTASESGGGGSAELDILGEGNGAVVSFSDGASAELAKCIADINPTQDLHGYDNPWTGGTGKNKLPNEITTISESGLDFETLPNGKIHIEGTTTSAIYKTDICEIFSLPEGSYIFSYDGIPNLNIQICNRAESQEFLVISNINPSKTLNVTASMVNDMKVRFVGDSGKTIDATIGVMIRESTAPSGFEPYSNICPISGHSSVTVTVSDGETSTTKTTPLGQTVYGGQLNVLTGELTIDRQIVDLGSLTWTRTDNSIIDVGYWFYANITGKVTSRNTINSNYRTSQYASIAQLVQAEGSGVDFVAIEAGGDTQYRIIDSSYTDATAFKTAMNGVQMCYFLATPQTVQLTPQEVNSLLGQNNISADTGDVDIVYVKASAPIQPNPTGTPTATLKKLGIEGTVFEVPSGGGGSSSGIHYSKTEHVIGTAEDENGIINPLYEKMTYISSLSGTGETEYSLGIINIKNVYYVECIAETSTIALPLFYNAGNDNGSKIQIFVSDKLSGKIKINKFNDNRSSFSGTVIIRYTKITD